MAAIFVGMMFLIYPKWDEPLESAMTLPQTVKDVLMYHLIL